MSVFQLWSIVTTQSISEDHRCSIIPYDLLDMIVRQNKRIISFTRALLVGIHGFNDDNVLAKGSSIDSIENRFKILVVLSSSADLGYPGVLLIMFVSCIN